MAEGFANRLAAVDAATLAPLVRQALNDDGASVMEFSVKPLSGGFAGETVGGHGTYRFSGTARSAHGTILWSMVLKVLGRVRGTGSTDLREWNYWKREILAYQSGLLDDLPGGIVAPRCFGVVENDGEEYWIWLEDVAGDTPDHWDMADYARVARHLGQFNGAYLAGNPIPDRPWFTRGRVRNWLDIAAPILDHLPRHLAGRTRRHWLTPRQAEGVSALWRGRDPLLAALDALPRSLCHHDAFQRNLFITPDRTVAIDWQIMGTGAVGEEIMPLVCVGVQFMHVPPEKMAELEGYVVAGYLEGLRDAGWRGEESLVRFGYGCAAALWGGVSTIGLWPEISDAENYKGIEDLLGTPIDAIVDCWAVMQDHYLKLGDEAVAALETR